MPSRAAVIRHAGAALGTLILGLAFFGYLSVLQPTPAHSLPENAQFPALPTEVQGLGGPILVNIVLNPVDEDGAGLWGSFTARTRTIEIESEDSSPAFRWHILGHELCHAALFDSGLLNTISDEGQEAICDAMGSARVQEMRGK